MIYVLAALLPPLGLLLNGQPFSAIFNLVLIVFCLVFGLIFHVLLLVPSAHALIAVHMKREDRRHREVVEAIRQHGPPPRCLVAQAGAGRGRSWRRSASTARRRDTGPKAVANPLGLRLFPKSLCIAGKRFDSASRHAIDHRQPHRWASIRRRCR